MRLLTPLAFVLFAAASPRVVAAPLALKTGTVGPGWRYWELTPNLAEAELQIAADDNGQLLEKLVPKGALAALNGGYFKVDYKPTGWVKDKVKEYGKPNRVAKKGGVFALKGTQLFLGRLGEVPFAPDFVVQNSPMLVDPGGKVAIKSSDGRHAARTVVCLNGSTLRFILLAAQTTQGPTLRDTAELLARAEKDGGFGCDGALNLDGGPSTGAWFGDDLKEKSPLPLVPIGYAIVIRKKA